MGKTRLSIDLEDELHEKLTEDAKRRDVPLAFLVRAVLAKHLGVEEHETRTTMTVRMLREHASNDRIAEALQERFGDANRSSISWHRSNLRRQGESIPSDAEAKEGERMAAFEASMAKR